MTTRLTDTKSFYHVPFTTAQLAIVDEVTRWVSNVSTSHTELQLCRSIRERLLHAVPAESGFTTGMTSEEVNELNIFLLRWALRCNHGGDINFLTLQQRLTALGKREVEVLYKTQKGKDDDWPEF